MKSRRNNDIKKKTVTGWRDKSRAEKSNPKATDLLSAQSQFGSSVEQMVLRKKWDEIIAILKPGLRHHRNEFWVHMQLATAYLERFKNYMAVEHGYEASQLNPSSRFANWLFTRMCFRSKLYSEVIRNCNEIIQYGEANILLDPYCKDLAMAQSLVNDCYYLMAATYKMQKKADLAKEAMNKYKEGRKEGIKSIYLRNVPGTGKKTLSVTKPFPGDE